MKVSSVFCASCIHEKPDTFGIYECTKGHEINEEVIGVGVDNLWCPDFKAKTIGGSKKKAKLSSK